VYVCVCVDCVFLCEEFVCFGMSHCVFSCVYVVYVCSLCCVLRGVCLVCVSCSCMCVCILCVLNMGVVICVRLCLVCFCEWVICV